MKLSIRRANAVRGFLTVNGINAERLVLLSYGEHQPFADNANERSRARDRRVMISLIR